MNYRIVTMITALALFTSFTNVYADTSTPENPKKQTLAGKYLNAQEAYYKWLQKKDIKVLDVRSAAEYVLTGHATMAVNIPVREWTGKYDMAKKDAVFAENPDFLKQFKARFKPEDEIFMMCRSGSRGAEAVNIAFKEGYQNVWNIVDGFEGDKVRDKDSYFDGKRMRNGWKNSGAPWTYDINPELTSTLPLVGK